MTQRLKFNFGRAALALLVATGLAVPGLAPAPTGRPGAPGDANPPSAARSSRVALVIGVKDYKNVSPLTNTLNDAEDMAATLKGLGFDVMLLKDPTLEQMVETIETYGERLRSAKLSLFYYSGHGLQYQGKNYLIPVGASLKSEKRLEFEAYDVDRLLVEIAGGEKGTNIVILDACRNNPFARSFRSADKGLAVVQRTPRSTLIAYATSPGNVASDNVEGRNGLYTGALLANMKNPDLRIEDVFKSVRQQVYDKSSGDQLPWETSSLPPGDLWLVGSPDPRMILIKGGTFQMGDTFGDGSDDEKPAHTVTVGDFYLANTELTVAEYREYIKASGKSMPEPPGWGWRDNDPMVNVRWFDAIEYCNWRSKKEGLTPVYTIAPQSNGFLVTVSNVIANWSANGYRLPTEAEWEYAARSGGKTQKYAGTSDESSLGDFAWFSANAANRAHFVGQKRPNGIGIFDMSGNAWEWCWDFYNSYSGKALDKNPRGPEAGGLRVLRGGSWVYYGVIRLRTTSRHSSEPIDRNANSGFRVAKNAQ